MKLPRIYEYFVPGQLVTISEMKEKLDRQGNTLRKRLSELSARGYLASVRQGLYVVCPPREKVEIPRLSPFEIASHVSKTSYVGFRTALQFHARQVPPSGDQIVVVSPTKFNGFSFDLRHYIWCQSSEILAVEEVWEPGFLPNRVRVTNLEKTIIDCLKRPLHCPDFDELLDLSLRFQRVPDFEVLLKFACDSEINALFNRLGLYLECLAARFETPLWVLHFLSEKMSRKFTDWTVQMRRESALEQIRCGASTHFIPGFHQFIALRAKWKIQFPRPPLQRTFLRKESVTDNRPES